MNTTETGHFGELRQNWGWLLAFGVLSVVLGIAGLGMTFVLTMTSVLFFGFLILFDGVTQLVQSFQCKGWKSILWHIAIAALYVLAGISIISNPLQASSFFTLILAFSFIFAGIARAVVAFQLRPASGWYWPLLSGIASVVLGGMVATRWPVSSLFVIGLFVALELIFHGWSTIFVALAAKNAPEAGGATLAPSTP